MKRNIVRLLSCVVVFSVLSLTAMSVPTGALSNSDLQNRINDLEQQSKSLESDISKLQSQINKQTELRDAIQKKIAITQQQINLCNSEINKINSEIEANKKEIEETNRRIEEDKLSFKKRLRAIYMSNPNSNLQVLMGAEDFSQFLELSQLTANVSARDKLMIEEMVAEIQKLEEKQKENDKLLEQHLETKKLVAEKQKELDAENAQIQSVINSISSDKKELDAQNADIEQQIKDYKNTLNAQTSNGGYSFVYDGGAFLWPVTGFYRISAGFNSNDSVHNGTHYGIDIAGSGISGKPILAISSGIVTKVNNSCTHNYGKSINCRCGGGYGNYVTINHGEDSKGNEYVVTYGHMSSAAVSVKQVVQKGQVIGYVGSTGWSTGYHLHLGISVNGVWKNPMNYYTKVS